jgi:nucleotide-binding universal stress UspA family protein
VNASPSILCAVDLSDHSRKVMQHAAAIADHFRARLVAATVTPPGGLSAHLRGKGGGTAESAVRSFVRDLVPEVESWRPRYSIAVESGSPASAILRLARDESADLIVVGTHGVSGLRKRVFGSTTAGVLRHATVPVLVVPAAAPDLHSLDDRRDLRHVGNVLTPIDFSDLSLRDARIAAGIASTLGASLLLTHVVASRELTGLDNASAFGRLDEIAARDRLDALRTEIVCDTPIEALVLSGHPAEEIAAIAAERNVGLIVMGLRGAGGVLGPRPGSIAYRVICLAPSLLLAIPPTLAGSVPRGMATDVRLARIARAG